VRIDQQSGVASNLHHRIDVGGDDWSAEPEPFEDGQPEPFLEARRHDAGVLGVQLGKLSIE
jgi:hypothetical protein